MLPGSGQEKMASLLETRNRYATLGNPRRSAVDAKARGAAYMSRCPNATRPMGLALADRRSPEGP